MQCGRPTGSDRIGGSEWDPSVSTSTPDLCAGKRVRRIREKSATEPRERDREQPRRTPRDGHSASETNLSARQNDSAAEDTIPIEPKSIAGGDENPPEGIMQRYMSPRERDDSPPLRNHQAPRKTSRQEKSAKCNVKKSRSCAADVVMSPVDADPSLVRQIRDIHNDMRSSVRIIKDSRMRLMELQKKPRLNEMDVKELSDRHELLLREMERFDRLTRSVQRVVDNEVITLRKPSQKESPNNCCPCYEPVIYHEMKMPHPTVTLGHAQRPAPTQLDSLAASTARSKSEIDLTRKLNESYDMQEKLVADNADLEVKRYILYKELMTKDQNLETCRAQIKRLQGELKLMSKENALLHEKIARNCPEGDASSLNYKTEPQKNQTDIPDTKTEELSLKLESYQNSTANFENQLGDLENEVKEVRENMAELKKLAEDTSRAGAGQPACQRNSCITQEKKPPPKKGMPCGICPPCPAPCNPSEPPKPIEREVAKLSIQLKSLEESYKSKLAECSVLRAELQNKKDALEKEKSQHKDAATKLKAAEQQLETLIAHNNMMLGTKDQAAEVEYNVKMLKQCYREAREEIDELRMLLKEQNEQLQMYRNKYMQSLQLLEEQKRQMENMDMDNNRVSEQINLEIQRIKNNFQERLIELTPLPDLLEKTQAKLKATQQAQAMAEHKVDKLTTELTVAREKIHELVYNFTVSAPQITGRRREDDLLELLQQRVTQLTQSNQALKDEIERLKGHVIRMEEDVLVKETRLAEKMTECAKLGGMLDKTRDEAARSVLKANDRVENMKQTMLATKNDMERQLIAGRAKLRIAEKNYEEMQCRMKCQIAKIRESYEQAQLRILGMSTTIARLRQAQPDHGDTGSENSEPDPCLCGVAFG